MSLKIWKLFGHTTTFINYTQLSSTCRNISLMNMLSYIQIWGSQFGLSLDALGQFNAQCSSKYRKAKRVNIKYYMLIMKALVFGYSWYSYRETESPRVNVTVYWDTCTKSEILKSIWCVSRYWCSWNAGLTPPHSLLPSKFVLLPSGWPEQWWTASWSLMMMMKKLPHLHPVHMLRPASRKPLWRIRCHVQHTSHSLRLHLRRRMLMSCKWRMKNCLQRYVFYEYLPRVNTYVMQKMSILCLLHYYILHKMSNRTQV